MVQKGFSERKFNLLLLKAFFDKGYSITNYFKNLIIIFGVTTRDVKSTIIIVILYTIFCFIFGWLYMKYGWFEAENEIMNRYNLFVKEMRKEIGSPKSLKRSKS